MFIKREGSHPKPVRTPRKRAKRIKPVSDKRAHELGVYKLLRKVFLEENEECGVCGGKATECHHKQGRQGEWLNKTQHWLAVCAPCHRKITDRPEWAFSNGYSEYRNR